MPRLGLVEIRANRRLRSSLSSRRSKDLDCREISAIARYVSREKRETFYGGVRTDIEIGQRRVPQPSFPPVLEEALARQKTSRPWKRLTPIQSGRKSGIQGLYRGVANGHFGIDDRIEDQRDVFSAFRQRVFRPIAPIRIVGGDIEQDVAVY